MKAIYTHTPYFPRVRIARTQKTLNTGDWVILDLDGPLASSFMMVYGVRVATTQRHGHVPRRGMASDTCGSVSVTMLWKTVSESRMVTPETANNGGRSDLLYFVVGSNHGC